MVILVRFGELALKSRYVRRQLRDRLVANIQDRFAAEGVECVTESDEARVYVHTADPPQARGLLARVFGIVSMSPATETRTDPGALRDLAVLEATRALSPGKAFALRTRRVGTHAFTSQDLARDIGTAVLAANPGVRVDLEEPDVEIHIEVRQSRGFVFREIWPGPGGLPLGSQGRALAHVDGEAGMVAAWMGMKRGCRVVVAAPDEGPHVDALRRWDTRLKVLRAMSRKDLEELVRIARAEAVFLGTRWSGFTEGSRPAVPVPVFEPTVGLTDAEVAGLAATIRSA
ncbi:MAG TPA: THUMP domain-containing protein [Thermoplasmata archaeon]|nr:THUMP domain-containing protein [Thermoplasmata archaeon]